MMKKRIILLLSFFVLIFSISGISAQNETSLELEVNYEYEDDIFPTVSVTQDDQVIDFTQTSDANSNKYILKLEDNSSQRSYKVSVSAPGYVAQSKDIQINSSLIGSGVFTLKPTDSYKMGRDVTLKADKILNFKNADSLLVITTAGMTRLNDATTEDALEGILNGAKGYISYGKGNLLTLSAVRTDPIDFAFFAKNGNTLTMVFFKNGSLNPLYNGPAGVDLTSNQWKKLQELLGNEDAYSYISMANAWVGGLPSDVLTQAAYHGHVCTGLISGQAMIQALLTHYPPRGEHGLPLENTAYYVLGVPGGSDDDAFTWSMDITPGKRAYIGIDTMVNKSMTGFIRWNDQTKIGILIIMSYNEEKIMNTFKKLYNLNPTTSVSNDLKYQKWLVEQLASNPLSLVDILYEFDGLNEENLYYLMGEEVGKGNVLQSAHGLDMEYILGLNLKNAKRETQTTNDMKEISYNKLVNIGKEASIMAINYFNSLGVKINKDMSNFFVLTSASFVRLNGSSTEGVLEGINQVLGSNLPRKTLLPVHAALWKDLVFDFFWVDPNNSSNTLSFSLKYDLLNDILIASGNSSDNESSANYILQSVLMYDPPFDVLIAWLFHNHVCGGSSPGYLIGDYIYEELPLGEDESYIYITTNANCKDDVISRILGVSPGMENYYNLRYDNNVTGSSNVGIAIKWNSNTKTGELIVINWQAPKFAPGSDSYEEYIKLYKKDYSSSNLVSLPNVSSTFKKPITEEDLKNIVSGAKNTGFTNSFDYIKSLPDVLPEKPVVPNPNPQKPADSQNNNQQQNNGTYLVNNAYSSFKNLFSTYSNSENPSTRSEVQNSPSTLGAMDNIEYNMDKYSEESSSKAYEINENKVSKNSNNNIFAYALIVVLIMGLIAGFGFMRHKRSQ
ncbi:MAG: hypothetical protein KO202_00660 [Methanobacteriaceae archaeon]|nr:hypothetical protein [Methanobacteriaceae archaeon]